ncbi:LysR family transcriptional regulator [Maritalea sp.]|uniref:LysR family transcriptional regulator n=1 Tax=Maritalea sp. TaxID=2003361 RepID=UPI003F4A9D42
MPHSKVFVLDIRFLESLIAVVENGSIAGAARLQNLTAAAVSQRIRTLEAELDVQLLIREGHAARPTGACHRLLPRAKMLVANTAALKSDIDISGLSGSFRLGAISTALIDFIPSAVRIIEQKAPNADLKIMPGSSSSLFSQLEQRQLDAAIIVRPSFELSKTMSVEHFCSQPFVSIGKLSPEQPLVVYDRQSWGGKIAWQWISANLPAHRILCELDSLETIATLVDQQLGAAIIPAWRGLTIQHPDLETNNLKNPPANRELVLVSNKDFALPLLMDVIRLALAAQR